MCIFCCFMKIPSLILRDSTKRFWSSFWTFLMRLVAVSGDRPRRRCQRPCLAPLGICGPRVRRTPLLREPQAMWLDCCSGLNLVILQSDQLNLVYLGHFWFYHLKVTCLSASRSWDSWSLWLRLAWICHSCSFLNRQEWQAKWMPGLRRRRRHLNHSES